LPKTVLKIAKSLQLAAAERNSTVDSQETESFSIFRESAPQSSRLNCCCLGNQLMRTNEDELAEKMAMKENLEVCKGSIRELTWKCENGYTIVIDT